MLRLPLLALLCLAAALAGEEDGYRSPYRLELPFTAAELIPDLLEGGRGDPRQESVLAHADWYRHDLRPPLGSWGPQPRAYPPPALDRPGDAAWRRARVLATAARFIGYRYRHHHIPDWDPPAGWHQPAAGAIPHHGKGVDCSNFTSFVYNQALGLGISSDIHRQAELREARINGGGGTVAVQAIPRPEGAEGWAGALEPGDLLFIRPRSGEGIAHVVLWVGPWGRPAGGPPLILDSHGAEVRDGEGATIPAGIHLRPFRPGSWYATCAAHALRLVQ